MLCKWWPHHGKVDVATKGYHDPAYSAEKSHSDVQRGARLAANAGEE
jgi:hypothetical protein